MQLTDLKNDKCVRFRAANVMVQQFNEAKGGSRFFLAYGRLFLKRHDPYTVPHNQTHRPTSAEPFLATSARQAPCCLVVSPLGGRAISAKDNHTVQNPDMGSRSSAFRGYEDLQGVAVSHTEGPRSLIKVEGRQS